MFKVGDRVRVIKGGGRVNIGDTGTVLQSGNVPYVQLDRFINGGDGGHRGKLGYCTPIIHHDIELIRSCGCPVCLYESVSATVEPCISCLNARPNWKPKKQEERFCSQCGRRNE